ncbi:hypothetical protein A1O1_00012 [Capronia coronata CBS 617.96]|uniref:Transcription factor domain-containing protein n=1 Tax=Capronia coronata CBS 617.96 TaxID=1182541 RepID=W9ZK80_9EURO|nr:uncharacterized protein A1O1_00012 [Capronia coronata CBS 617.96]EXJ94894.1 hypothetical protein A1O1_00012 [Capronia coronata CBS 617.96]
MPPPQSTWATRRILDGPSVDKIISALTNTAVAQFDRTQAQIAVLGPFSVLSFPHPKTDPPSLPPENLPITSDVWPIWPLDQESRSLFQHYVSVISSKMMPFEDSRNPWKTRYPSMALSDDSAVYLAIRHAILSQAAAHFENIGYRTEHMKVLAMGHYSESLKALSTYLSETTEYDYGAVLASILSLIMAETYGGGSVAWRYHLKIAWDLATKSLPQKPWLFSETAWLTTQSLCMLKLRMSIELDLDDAPTEHERDHVSWEEIVEPKSDTHVFQDMIASVSSRLEFGFTVGAAPQAAEGLSEAVTLIRQVKRHGLSEVYRSKINKLTERLSALATGQAQYSTSLRDTHQTIFTLGIIIFIQRQTINPAPSALTPYSSRLFACIQNIDARLSCDQPADRINRDSSHVSLWPVFLAAVECFRPQELRTARSWLGKLGKSGIGNRGDVSKVVQGVWKERRRRYYLQVGVISEAEDVDDDEDDYDDLVDIDGIGQIIVDWREVMRVQGVDILLV